jgi:hypothetical protein
MHEFEVTVLRSRSFNGDDTSYLIPFADLLNHQNTAKVNNLLHIFFSYISGTIQYKQPAKYLRNASR